MENALSTRTRNLGLIAFLLSGTAAISTGIVVTILQEKYGFSYAVSGTLMSMMNLGNLLCGFAIGMISPKFGMKRTVCIFGLGYLLGYLLMGLSGITAVLMLSFLLVGIAKGCALNTCTLLVGNNSKDRTIGMNLMHACYAIGALSCPFVIALAHDLALIILALVGLLLWTIYLFTPMSNKPASKGERTDWSFMKDSQFWLLTGLIFCQNASETSVTSWLVSYFKGSGILSGTISTYTVTVMWFATLVCRLIIAFVVKLKKPAKAMSFMSAGCIIFYFLLIQAKGQLLAIVLLFMFAFCMAPLNPTAVSLAGSKTSTTSLSIMLPISGLGALIMPYIIGIVAENFGIGIGMLTNLVPCIGLLVFSVLVNAKLSKQNPLS